MNKKQIVIIGGGAAGFFCAANLDPDKWNVTILEQQSDVLQKVKISGGGRCNVTHACFDPRELVEFYPRGSKELRSVFSRFQPGDTIHWFDERKVPLVAEQDNRMFPQSNSSQSIIDVLVNEVVGKGFEIKTRSVVSAIEFDGSHYHIKTTAGNIGADVVVYTTGSSPKSLQLIQQLGHQVVAPVPSLFTFNIKNEILKDLPGTTFPNAQVSIPELGTEESGPLLITHWGLSGPAILKLSAWKAREIAACNYRFSVVVNFLGMSDKNATEVFLKFKKENPKKSVGSSKIYDITNRFWHRVLWLSKVDLEKSISAVSAKELQQIVLNLCKSTMEVTGKSTHKDEFVTAGGVDLKEINFKNMSSKILPHFYLAGEVLNIDAVTGGFNFQHCWSEGWIIAQDLNAVEI